MRRDKAARVPVASNERLERGMKTRSRDQGRTAGVGSVGRPSPGRTGMAAMRRLQPFPQTTGNQAVLYEVDSRVS